ncbi:MAG: dihydropteroate synthase [Succinivibrio sp.]|nr:dihydropteroate synthase [Succinivibrio sp.]
MHISFNGRTLSLDTPKIMGILNVTPDSFSDGGNFNKLDNALAHAREMVEDGASIIDIGGESTRPGAAPVSLDEELSRVIPAVEAISKNLDVMISIDTSQPQVMKEAVAAGAHIWNDIRALRLEGALKTAATLEVPVILMHMQGDPVTMQVNPHYTDVVSEVYDFLKARCDDAIDAGIKKENIILDLGFGFGKSVKHNFQLLDSMDLFVKTGYPVLSALSRKSMIGAATGIENPKDRTTGSVAGALLSIEKGAQLVRVHDVKETKQAFDAYQAMLNSRT